MSVAIDTNVPVRLLVRDDEAQYAAARRLVDEAAAAEEPVPILFGALLETEWVLRSRYKLDKASIAGRSQCFWKVPKWRSNTHPPRKRRSTSGRSTPKPTSPTACSPRAPRTSVAVAS